MNSAFIRPDVISHLNSVRHDMDSAFNKRPEGAYPEDLEFSVLILKLYLYGNDTSVRLMLAYHVYGPAFIVTQDIISLLYPRRGGPAVQRKSDGFPSLYDVGRAQHHNRTVVRFLQVFYYVFIINEVILSLSSPVPMTITTFCPSFIIFDSVFSLVAFSS